MKPVKGAEAELKFTEDKVIKKRSEKNYRHKELDRRLRKKRTSSEKRLMKEARKHGVNVPEVEKTEEDELEIELLKGDQLRDVLEENIEAAEEMGENVAKLHRANIIHGDLTTRNVFLNDQVYLIDFGLSFRSERVEDKAVDIHLLKQVLETSHTEVREEAWEKFVEGYRNNDTQPVLDQLEDVEKRGRYK